MEKILYSEVGGHKFPRGGGDAPLLEVFRVRLGRELSNLL